MKIIRRFLPALFIASAAAFMLTGCTKTVDLLQYANVSITGESGDAEADIMIDYNGLGKELFGKDKNQTAFDEAAVEYSLGDDLVYTVDPEDGIFNGDTVTLTVTASDSFLKKHDIKLASTSKEIKVSGLEESGTPAKADDSTSESDTVTPAANAEPVDPFDESVFRIVTSDQIFNEKEYEDKVTVVISGQAPHLNIDVKNRLDSSDPRAKLEYTVTNKNDTENTLQSLRFFKNDTATISVAPHSGSDFYEQYSLTNDSMDIDLSTYPVISEPNKVEDIGDAAWEYIQSGVNQSIENYFDFGGDNYATVPIYNENTDVVATYESKSNPRFLGKGYMIAYKDDDYTSSFSTGKCNAMYIPVEFDYVDKEGNTGTAVSAVSLTSVPFEANGEVYKFFVYFPFDYQENTYNSLDSFVSQVVEKTAEKKNYSVQEFDLPW